MDHKAASGKKHFYKSRAARTIEKNADRMIEHLVQVLSEWIVMCIEPAKELTRIKEPECLFLHDKDFWFRSIWIDLHQAISIDRKSSRDRAPVGLARCICKDDQAKGPNAPIKLMTQDQQHPCLCLHLDGTNHATQPQNHCRSAC